MTNADRARRLELNRISELLGYEKMLVQQITVQHWQHEDNDRMQAMALINLGAYAFDEFRDAEAKAYLTESCALAEKLGDDEMLATGLANLGRVHRYCGSRHEAIRCYLRAWTLAIRESVPELIETVAMNFMIFMDEEICEDISSDALADIESGALRHGHGVLAANLARVHGEMLLRAGKPEQADTALARATVYASAINDWQCLAEIREMREATSRPLFQARLRAKAHGYLATGRVSLAVGVFARIVASFGEQTNNASDRIVWLEIGTDCLEAGLWQPACGHLARLYEVAARNDDANMAADALVSLSAAQRELGEMESAQGSLIEAIRIRAAQGNLIGEAMAHFHMAGVLFEAGKPDEGRRQAKRFRECLEQDGSEEAASVWRTLFEPK